MAGDFIKALLNCAARADANDIIFDSLAVQESLNALAEGRALTSANRTHLESFLSFVGHDGFFDPAEKENAALLLEQLTEGRLRGPPHAVISGMSPSESPSALALVVPPGTEPAFDLLIRTPHQSLLNLFTKAEALGVGEPRQREAIQKALWLRPLDPADYRQAVAFLEKVQKKGLGDKAARNQARFLIDLLSPGMNPHGVVERLRTSGMVQKIKGLRPKIVSAQVVPRNQAGSHLDELLLQMSRLLQQAAEEGDSYRLEKLAIATREVARAIEKTQLPSLGLKVAYENRPAAGAKSFWPKFFEPVKPFAGTQYQWEGFDQVASNPAMNAALMPLAVVGHVLAAAATGEISWEESWGEGVGALGGTAVFGGTLLGTVGAWHLFGKVVGNERFKEILRRVNKVAPPRVRAYLVPLLMVSAFTFVALRQSQNLPLDEEGEYRWNFLKELAGGFGVNFVVTGGVFFGANRLLAAFNRVPAGKLGAAAVLGVASFVGTLAQEIYTSWQRRHYRQELKEKTYADVVSLLDLLPQVEPFMRPSLKTAIERKFSILIALNCLDLPSVEFAIKVSEEKEATLEGLRGLGYSDKEALDFYGRRRGIAKVWDSEKEAFADSKIHEMAQNKDRAMLPVSVLPAQQRRVLELWDKDLDRVKHFLLNPVSLTIGRDQVHVPSDQFAEWGFPQTMALFHKYIGRLKETAEPKGLPEEKKSEVHVEGVFLRER